MARRHADSSILALALVFVSSCVVGPRPIEPVTRPVVVAPPIAATSSTIETQASASHRVFAASVPTPSDWSGAFTTLGIDERCPAAMALVSTSSGSYCIDRYECSLERRLPSGQRTPWPGNVPVDDVEGELVAVSTSGRKPQGYINLLQASRACENAGKRLCTSPEWVAACRGPRDTRYPYGNERRANVCNDRFSGQLGHPVVRLFRAHAPAGADPALMWTQPWLNDSRLHELSETVTATGSFSDCTNEYGVADMVGNLHEWVLDPTGVFRGGFFMDTRLHGEGCDYRTSVHGPKYHDYSTGFRCCADALEPIRLPALEWSR